MEMEGQGTNYSSYYYYYYYYYSYYCYYYYCYYYYYCSYSPTTERAPDITTPPINSPLMGKTLNIISFTSFSPLVRKGINPDKSRGWGILISSPKFI